jgi:putative transcriptional regulator
MPPFESPIYLGGPVEQNTLHFIHQLDSIPGAKEVIPGLFWSGDFDLIKEKIGNKELTEEEVLFFVGYSGWGPGQLQEELDRKSWIIAPENPDFVFTQDQENLWQDLLRSMGSRYKVISNYPVDPRLN